MDQDIELDALTIDPTIQVRDCIDPAIVERYMDAFDALPLIDVVQTDTEYLLVDGFHRVEAGRRLHRDTIAVRVTAGTRDDALSMAATANAKHGKNLTRSERDGAIRRLHEINPERSLRDIGAEMGVSHETVRRAITVTNVTPEEIPIHEYLNIIPAMDEETYRGLKRSIEEYGLDEPIVLHDGKIIDGRYRYRACRELGIPPQFTEYEGDYVLDMVISLNTMRRNLTEAQKATVVVEAEALMKYRRDNGSWPSSGRRSGSDISES
jgi:ParB-like chromosome segregation protein Spo0J